MLELGLSKPSLAKVLLQQSDFTYLGSFKCPDSIGCSSDSSFSYGGLTHRYLNGNLQFFLLGHTGACTPCYEVNYPGVSAASPPPLLWSDAGEISITDINSSTTRTSPAIPLLMIHAPTPSQAKPSLSMGCFGIPPCRGFIGLTATTTTPPGLVTRVWATPRLMMLTAPPRGLDPGRPEIRRRCARGDSPVFPRGSPLNTQEARVWG